MSQIRFTGYSDRGQFLMDEYVKRAERINSEHPKLVKMREKILDIRQMGQREQVRLCWPVMSSVMCWLVPVH